ncbi:Gfo/Idh/MocA family oxidoreductase [Fulvivirgaceae bacterium BMA10]|uniref:Gfo/Idh/MocA family oxidoreductase n=1 Tax=Splendidivirga corallicola TaxID=3051826 RepID=A0ABT8KJ07_9BACT|nr:Gfo/Idh/MocA family oxidoreductase [Fulvivirgaceae bacterium BMA10]
MARKIRMGMVGGGEGSFIGAVHRMAANLDGQIELVCGAFSSSAEKSKSSGEALFLDPERVYGSFEEMILKEKELGEDKRMDMVSIVTPNHMHFAPAKLALENGFHVVCDKPVAFSLEQAKELEQVVNKSNLIFALTHNYTGYPMVKEARHMVKTGKIGKVRKVVVEYPQGWLSTKLEDSKQKQADWRTDPNKAGISCCMGDIGSHAENLAEYITGLQIKELAADLSTFVEGRLLDDDGTVLLRFDNGAKGSLFASQIAAGEENELKIRIWGEKAGLEWLQSDPNTLIVKWLDKPKEIYRTGINYGYFAEETANATRLPSGHPEGYLEAFANIYKNVAKTINAINDNRDVSGLDKDYPKIEDGVRGMAFIEAVVSSSNQNASWVQLADWL